MQYELDLLAVDKVLFGVTAELVEIHRLKKELQKFQLFFEVFALALLKKLTRSLIILSLGLCFHAGVEFWLKFYIDLFIDYLPHPLGPPLLSSRIVT